MGRKDLKKIKKGPALILALCALLWMASWSREPYRDADTDALQETAVTKEEETPALKVLKETGISAAESVELQEEEEADRIPLTSGQEALLKPLYLIFAEKGAGTEALKEAAAYMYGNAEALAGVLFEDLGGERILYSEDGASSALDGAGLVPVLPSLVFFGLFEDGRPQGWCVAVQVTDAGAVRVDYCIGEFENGRLNGQGSVGYAYLSDPPENEEALVFKSGFFIDDLMGGEVTMVNASADGQASHFTFFAEGGITVLDERWTYIKSLDAYQLLSEDSPERAYILPAESAGLVLWQNFLSWQE